MAYLSEHCSFAHLTEDLAARLHGFECEQEPAIADFFRDGAVLNERQLLPHSFLMRKPKRSIAASSVVSLSAHAL